MRFPVPAPPPQTHVRYRDGERYNEIFDHVEYIPTWSYLCVILICRNRHPIGQRTNNHSYMYMFSIDHILEGNSESLDESTRGRGRTSFIDIPQPLRHGNGRRRYQFRWSRGYERLSLPAPRRASRPNLINSTTDDQRETKTHHISQQSLNQKSLRKTQPTIRQPFSISIFTPGECITEH